LFDFRQALHDARGGSCHHFTWQCFSGPVNSLVARGKKTEKSATQPVSKNIGSAAHVLPVIKQKTSYFVLSRRRAWFD